MIEQISEWLATSTWWGHAVRIALFYFAAWIIHLLSGSIAGRLVRLSHIAPEGRRLRPERLATLRSLTSNTISVLAFVGATLLTVGQFVSLNTLVWVVGLFSAAFGLGARPIISDFLTGVGFLFEDTFAEGEKVEVMGLVSVEGVIEKVSLRATWLRSRTGELYVVPNGEVRVVRNFSRGLFSTADVTCKVASSDLDHVILVLEELGRDAVVLLPNLLEPWQVISESGVIGQQTELTLLAKARFGKAAEMRPRLLTLVQHRLAEEGIELLD